MNIIELKFLLDLSKRKEFYINLLKKFKNLDNIRNIHYYVYEIPEGLIPVLFIANSLDIRTIKFVKVLVAAQHNEYNGLFGILKFLQEIGEDRIEIDNLLINNQILILFPLMNPYGFLNPRKDNKSGYFLKNGSNLNRFWRKVFVPNYSDSKADLNKYPMPKQTSIFKKVLENYWDDKNIGIYIMDFHETSLMDRFMKELSLRLNDELYTYKFTHWLQEKIIVNVIKLNNIKLSHQNLFLKCNPSANHKHLNLTMREIELIYKKLLNYIAANNEKLPFYFSYNNKSKIYCKNLAEIIYHKLRDKLWETKFPAYPHNLHNHGCFVNMNKASNREKLYSMELESKKQFFNIFREIEKSKSNPEYFEKKVKSINLSIDLVYETIKEMINLF